MNLYKTTYRFFSYLFILVLFVGLACSSDDNTIPDDDEPLSGESNLTMKVNGESWVADEAHSVGLGGELAWEETEEGGALPVWINAVRYLDDSESSHNTENLTIHMYFDLANFYSPKGTYPIPPPVYDEDLESVGFAEAIYYSPTNTYTANSDHYDPSRSLGEFKITDYKIESYMVYELYTRLVGTFEVTLFHIESEETIELTEGRFNLGTSPIL